jgi:hypothetical protein
MLTPQGAKLPVTVARSASTVNVCGKCTHSRLSAFPLVSRFGPNAILCKKNPPQVTSFIVNKPATEDEPAGSTIIDHTAYPVVGINEEGCGEFKIKVLTSHDAPDIVAALERAQR